MFQLQEGCRSAHITHWCALHFKPLCVYKWSGISLYSPLTKFLNCTQH